MKLILLVALVAGALILWPGWAGACSCAGGEARDRLAAADAAAVAVVQSRRGGGNEVIYTLRSERVVKGSLGETFEIVSSGDEASCGMDLPDGRRIGIVLSDDHRAGDRHRAGICNLVDPDELLAAADERFPAPAGRGRLSILVAGPFGDAGVAGYARSGRLLAYGFGTRGRALSICPGRRYAVQAGDDLYVIRLRDLRVVRSRKLPGNDTESVRCLDRRARAVGAATFFYGSGSRPRDIVHVTARRARRLQHGSRVAAAIGPRDAAVLQSRGGRWRLLSIDLVTGQPLEVAAGAGQARAVAVSPDGRRAAVQGDDGSGTGRGFVTIADLRRRAFGTRAANGLGRASALVWLTRRVAGVTFEGRRGVRLRAGGSLVPEPAGQLPRFPAHSVALLPGRLVGVRFGGALLSARTRAGRATQIAPSMHQLAGGIAAIPGGVVLRGASDRAASPARGAEVAARGARKPCER